ncbi:MAG: peptide chain release factor 1 [Myxococcales bacterium]|nr:peptide chain release factor 1 [Myxococcales bacterium]MCB9628948.1 peptide chain release factor 1 [Sandaracinaceae bacterium]
MLPIDKLEALTARYRDTEEILCQPDVLADSKRLTRLTRERSDLQEVVTLYQRYQQVVTDLQGHREALNDADLRELAELEIPELEAERERLEAALNVALLPKDPDDLSDTVLEIRAGAGGEEAALWAADLFRMYSRYAETVGWKVELISKSEASAGGLKEVVATLSGDRVYSVMRFEGGVHRVQRVPATESQGRIHTSTATVVVMPESEAIEDVHIDPKDLDISATLAGGPGGQHVNTTHSAVIVKHLPTGIMIRADNERSQHQNKAKALQLLRMKLLQMEQDKQAAEIGAERRAMVGSGDRSEKIRTYNYPQNRVTDHRIGLTLHNLDRVVAGELGDVFQALRSHHQAELLSRHDG